MIRNICIVGNIVADFIAAPVEKLPGWGELYDITSPIRLNIGGNGAISAVCSARLGLSPYLMGTVGSDLVGKQLISMLKKEGVRTDLIGQTKKYSTSTTLAIANNSGERTFFHHMGSSEAINKQTISGFSLDNMSALMISSIFLLPALDGNGIVPILKRAKKMKLPTFLDVAWDPSGKWTLGDVHEFVDYFVPNEVELQNIAGTMSIPRCAERLHNKGMETIIVKRGKSGCTVYVEGKRAKRVRAPAVDARDTTGAGDAFNAGFIYGILNNGDVYESAEFATIAASMSVREIGGTTGAPTKAEIEDFKTGTGGYSY